MELLDYTFFRNAVAGVLIISIAAAIIGTYITTRRLVAISGGITHACFGGLGLGYYLGVNPIVLAAVFAVGASAGVEWLSRRRVREDSAIAVVWALGMAVGVLFVFMTPGYVPELNAFLFGNILTINWADLVAFGVYTVVLAGCFGLFYKQIVAVAFDRDFARVIGLKVDAIAWMMTLLVALGIVLTIRLVGIMLLMSMLTLPPMVAETMTSRYRRVMLLSILISTVTSLGGLWVGVFVDVPCSAIIVMIQVGVYAVARAVVPLLRNKRGVRNV